MQKKLSRMGSISWYDNQGQEFGNESYFDCISEYHFKGFGGWGDAGGWVCSSNDSFTKGDVLGKVQVDLCASEETALKWNFVLAVKHSIILRMWFWKTKILALHQGKQQLESWFLELWCRRSNMFSCFQEKSFSAVAIYLKKGPLEFCLYLIRWMKLFPILETNSPEDIE